MSSSTHISAATAKDKTIPAKDKRVPVNPKPLSASRPTNPKGSPPPVNKEKENAETAKQWKEELAKRTISQQQKRNFVANWVAYEAARIQKEKAENGEKMRVYEEMREKHRRDRREYFAAAAEAEAEGQGEEFALCPVCRRVLDWMDGGFKECEHCTKTN